MWATATDHFGLWVPDELGLDPQRRRCGERILGAGVRTIAVGSTHVCALKTEGSLWCWSGYFPGQDPLVPIDQPPLKIEALGTDVTELWSGRYHVCVRRRDSSLWCWGGPTFGKTPVMVAPGCDPR